jgi:hypothetical protein
MCFGFAGLWAVISQYVITKELQEKLGFPLNIMASMHAPVPWILSLLEVSRR